MEQTGGSALAPQRFAVLGAIVGAVEPVCVMPREKDRSDRAFITLAPRRALILVKVPCCKNGVLQ